MVYVTEKKSLMRENRQKPNNSVHYSSVLFAYFKWGEKGFTLVDLYNDSPTIQW